MSQENVEVVRRAHAAWNADDFDALRPLLADEIEWRTALATDAEGIGSLYVGRDAAQRVWNDYRELFEEFRVQEVACHDLGERVLMLSEATIRGRTSGVELHEELAQIMTLRDGKIVSSQDFRSHAEALEAVGLSG